MPPVIGVTSQVTRPWPRDHVCDGSPDSVRFGIEIGAFRAHDERGITKIGDLTLDQGIEGSNPSSPANSRAQPGREHEAARRALRPASLDPGDSDEPGPARRIGMATFADNDDFIERLPTYLADITRDLERRIQQNEAVEVRVQQARQQMTTTKRRTRAARP